MTEENEKLFAKYENKYGSGALEAIRGDYKKQFQEEPPFWEGDLADATTKYTLGETIDIYLTALRKGSPYKLKEGDIIPTGEMYSE